MPSFEHLCFPGSCSSFKSQEAEPVMCAQGQQLDGTSACEFSNLNFVTHKIFIGIILEGYPVFSSSRLKSSAKEFTRLLKPRWSSPALQGAHIQCLYKPSYGVYFWFPQDLSILFLEFNQEGQRNGLESWKQLQMKQWVVTQEGSYVWRCQQRYLRLESFLGEEAES